MVAMSSGITKNGGTAVFGTYAPFLQRTYDQLSHDLCLNDNRAVMLVLSPWCLWHEFQYAYRPMRHPNVCAHPKSYLFSTSYKRRI